MAGGEKGIRCKSVALGQRCKRGRRLLVTTAQFYEREGAVEGGSASQKTCLGEKDFSVRNKSVSRGIGSPGYGLFFVRRMEIKDGRSVSNENTA